MGDWAGAITQHHERWDGEGYPHGLRAENISLAGRIVAVADSFEVMTAARSYKKPLSIAAARTELTRCAGAQFDPTIVRAFLNVSIGRLRRVLSPLAWAGQLPFIPAAAAIPAPGAMAATTALVGGLLLGPTAMPFLGGDGAAEAATATVTTTVPNPSADTTERIASERLRRDGLVIQFAAFRSRDPNDRAGFHRTRTCTRCRESVRSPTRRAGGIGTRAGHARCRRCGYADCRVLDHTGRLCRHSARRSVVAP